MTEPIKEESLTISDLLHEYVLLKIKNQELERTLDNYTYKVRQGEDAKEAFDKASKDWNSFTIMARVAYAEEDGIEIDQYNLHFYVDLEGADKIYKPGDVVMVIGTITSYRGDDPCEGIHNSINITAHHIQIISSPSSEVKD